MLHFLTTFETKFKVKNSWDVGLQVFFVILLPNSLPECGRSFTVLIFSECGHVDLELFVAIGMMLADTCASTSLATKPKVKKQPKPNQRRVYDANGYRRRVDCVCFRDETRSEVSPT